MKYVIGSGWWCDGNRHPGTNIKQISDFAIGPNFSKHWLACIDKYLSPTKILIVDSNSPIKPNIPLHRSDIEYLSLDQNYGHVSHCRTKYCGWTRAFLAGAFYAYTNDADFVFLEQDLLFKGDIVQAAFDNIDKMGANYSHGIWNHNLRTEISFLVIKKDAILDVIYAYTLFEESDIQIRPEHKFFDMSKRMKFTPIPFEFGRRRPLDFNQDIMYAQKMADEDIKQFVEIINS